MHQKIHKKISWSAHQEANHNAQNFFNNQKNPEKPEALPSGRYFSIPFFGGQFWGVLVIDDCRSVCSIYYACINNLEGQPRPLTSSTFIWYSARNLKRAKSHLFKTVHPAQRYHLLHITESTKEKITVIFRCILGFKKHLSVTSSFGP